MPAPVPDKPVPVFTRDELHQLERACADRSFQDRRDAAVIAVFRSTGMRLSELAGIRYDPGNPRRSDLDLWHREITVHGKGRKTRTVKIGHDAARAPRPLHPGPRTACPGPPPAAVARDRATAGL